MVWKKNDNWKWQLRDSKGRWIEMGRGVKWYSPTLGREVSGTVVGQKGRNAVVSLTSEPNDAKTGKPQQVEVKGSDIEVIQNKATLNPQADNIMSKTDEMLKQGQRQTTDAGPKATVPTGDEKSNKAAAAEETIEDKLDALEDVTVKADGGELEGDDLDDALDEAKFKVSGSKGDYTVSADKDDNDDWAFVVTDKDGNEISSTPMGADDTKDVVAKIDKSITDHEADQEGDKSSEEEAPASSPAKDDKYNAAGLTDEEQKLADGYDRMIERAEKAGNFDAAERYRAQKEELIQRGQERTNGPAAEQPKADTDGVPESETSEGDSKAPEKPEVPANPEKPVEAPEAAPKASEAPATENIEPSIGKSLFPEGFSIQKDKFGRIPMNRMVSAHTGAMTDTELGKLKNLNKDYQLAQADQDPKRIAAAERALAQHARGIESRLKKDPEVTLRNRKIDAIEQPDVNNVIKQTDPSDNWKKGEDGNWTSSKTGEVKNSADLVDVISPNSKSQTGYKPIRDKDMPKNEEATPAPEATPESTPTPDVAPEPEAEVVDTESKPAVMSLPVTNNLLNRIRRATEDAGMTEEESGLRFTSDRVNPIEVTDLDKAEETLKGVKARVDDLASTARGANSKIPLNQASKDLSANIARIREQRDGAGTTEAPEATTAPETSPEAPEVAPETTAKPEATKAPVSPMADGAEILAAAGVERTEPYALPGEKFPPTRQQQDIIDAVMAGKNTSVQALAGSGKTTTLEALAKRLKEKFPGKSIAYVAFNRSVKLEAEGRMPENVEAKTQHGLAYGWAPKWMKDRSNDRNSLRRADEVAAFLGIKNTIRPADGGEPVSAKEQALAAVRTVDTFANSAEERPDASHMPEKVREMGPEVEAAVLDAAQKIWDDISQPGGQMRFSLDHMRKLWALTKPDLSKAGSGLKRPADIIFMDEAQDTPKVMAALMDHQTAQMVVVGDSNQNIYSSFTGSIDYMSQVAKDVELPLTKSWRFGPAVADIGNRFLELGKANTRVEGGGESSIVDDMPEPDAILVRSNGGMIGEIIGELEKGRTVGVPAGTKKDLQSLVDSAAFLRGQGEAPSKMHDDLAAYRSWDEVVSEAEAGNATLTKIANMMNQHGVGGMRQILNQIVEKGGENDLSSFVLQTTSDPNVSWANGKTFGTNASDYLKQAGFRFGEIPGAEPMKSGANKGKPRKGWFVRGDDDARRAAFQKAKEFASGEAVDVTISTAHKSKGLEWDKVKIGDDFRGPQVDETTGETTMPSPEELRVAYVAVTRAKGELMPGSLGYVFDYTQENGGIPEAHTEDNDPAKDNESTISTSIESTDEEPAAPVAEEAPEAPTAPESTPEEAPAPAPAPEQGPEATPEGSPEPAPVAHETPVPEDEQQPEPEPEDVVDNPDEVPEPAPLPTKPANTPEPEPETPEAAPEAEPEPEAPAAEESAPAPLVNPYAPKPMEDYSDEEFAGLPDGTRFPRNRQGGYYEKTGPNSWKQVSKGLEQVGGTYTDKDVRDAEGVPTGAAPETAPEPEAPVEAPTPAPAPAPAPEEAPAPAPGPAAPAPETTPAPEAGERPTSGTQAPDAKPLHPVKIKAANYPDGTIIHSARTEDAIEKTNGQWHVLGDPNTPADVMDIDNPFVYDMPKQEADSFDTFEGIDSAEPGDIVITRKGNQAAVIGKRDGKLIVAPHNQTPEQRSLRPAVAMIDPVTVRGINHFAGSGATAPTAQAPAAPATSRPRTPFSSNRGNTNLSIKDATGNEIKTGDTVRTDQGTGTIVRVRPSDGPAGSVFVQFADGTIKSFRGGKVRSADAVETAGGDDPSKMEIGAMGEAGDGRAFMVGKGNKPIFKGDRIALADGREGTVSGFAKGVQSVNLKMDDGTSPRKKASVVDAIDYNAPATTTSESDTTPAPEAATEVPDTNYTPSAGGNYTPLEGNAMAQELFSTFAENGITPEKFAEYVDGLPNGTGESRLNNGLGVNQLEFLLQGGGTPVENRRAAGMIKALAGAMKINSDYAPAGTYKLAEKKLFAELDTSLWAFTEGREREWLNGLNRIKPKDDAKPLSEEELANYNAANVDFSNFDYNTSRFNPLSETGLTTNDTDDIVTNSAGDKFRPGVRVADADGNVLGIIRSAYPNYAFINANTNDVDNLDATLTRHDLDALKPLGDVAWDTSTDLDFSDASSTQEISERMRQAYQGVAIDFDGLPLPLAQQYAAATSKVLNKYPMLKSVMVSIGSGQDDDNTYAYAQQNVTTVDGYQGARIVFNTNGPAKNSYDKYVESIRDGVVANWSNNVPEGEEAASTVIHEFGHVLDRMVGKIDENDLYDVISTIWGDYGGDESGLAGRKLFELGALSKYSTKDGRINAPELIAEAFADAEQNGVDAKPLSKMIHAELIRRLSEADGGASGGMTTPDATAATPAAEGDAVPFDYGLATALPDGMTLADQLELGSLDSKLTPEQKAVFEGAFDALSDRINANLPEGVTVHRENTEWYGLGIGVQWDFMRGNERIGSMTRSFMRDEIELNGEEVTVPLVHSDRFMIIPDERGKGIASAALKESQELYKQLGMQYNTLQANIDVGGYAWARAGFKFAHFDTLKFTFNEIKNRIGYNYFGDKGPNDAERAEFEALLARVTEDNFNSGKAPTPLEISMIGSGPDGNGFGKTALLDTTWEGIRAIV